MSACTAAHSCSTPPCSSAADWQCEFLCSCGCVAGRFPSPPPDAHTARAPVSGCMPAPIAHAPAAGPDLSATGHRSCRAQSRRHTRTRCSQPHDRAHGRLMLHTPPIRTGQARYLAAARSGPRRAGLGLARRALREHSRRPGHAAQKCAAARPRTQPLEAANRAHQDRVPAITWLLPLHPRVVPPLGSLPRPCKPP